MKRFLLFLCLLGTLLSSAAEKDLLFFCGGRLFGSGRQRKVLDSAGCSMQFVDTRDLAGFGGNIRQYEAKEPEKKDGITPEFARLGDYRVVMFSVLPLKEMEQILTEERISQLRTYVKNGGVLLLNINTPARLGDLLPVTLKGGERRPSKIFMTRPDYPGTEELPERWKKMTSYRIAAAKPGAKVHCELLNASGKVVAPAIVSQSYGKGRVIFYNGFWQNSSHAASFSCWAYSEYLIRGLVSFATGRPLKNQLLKLPPRTVPEPLDALEYTVKSLENKLTPGGKVTQKGKDFVFANGICFTLQQDGGVSVQLPGVSEPLQLAVPVFQTAGNPQNLNGDNNEAIVSKYDLRKYPVQWTKIRGTAERDKFIVRYTSAKAAMRWEFQMGSLSLDGRNYIGYGDRIVVEKLPVFLESVSFASALPNGKIRRNTCYTRPRGYLETELSNAKGGISESRIWQFFCSGQPFTYLFWKGQGIFAELVDTPIPCYAQFIARQDGKLHHSLRLLAGRRKTPAELPVVWHLFSPGAEQGNNDYIALYQYARQHLRTKCGLKTFPQVTQCSFYLHGRSLKDLEQSAKAAEKLNFRSVWLSLCPLQMTEITGEKLTGIMQMVQKHGLLPHPWTAGGYNHKDSNPVFKGHPEWFIRRKDGSVYRYFKKLPVGDFNNDGFRNWFAGLILQAKKNGLVRVYHDMGGEISSLVNYYPPQQSHAAGLEGFIKLLQLYTKENIPCSVEGMNPLVKDQALFRPEVSWPLAGKEFAYVGGTPLASADNGQRNALFFDYFRLLMHNATINIDVDGFRFGVERVPGELKIMNEIGKLNVLFNKAHEFVPAAFVRETPFGTAWIGLTTDTGALFFEREVKDLKLHLPAGWQVKDNASLKNIPRHSVIFLEKKK